MKLEERRAVIITLDEEEEMIFMEKALRYYAYTSISRNTDKEAKLVEQILKVLSPKFRRV